jgi:putative Mg2+ transporter-C (MgtC) family protein
MDTLWNELTSGFSDTQHLIVILIRMIASALLGAAIGFEREHAGKKAGLRTHMLVSTGTTVFVLAGLNSGMPHDAISRVIQGIITGIGFVGAGSILKREEDKKIEGVTTSAAIWMAAAIGVSAGLGGLGLSIIATALTLIVLRITLWFEDRPAPSEPST